MQSQPKLKFIFQKSSQYSLFKKKKQCRDTVFIHHTKDGSVQYNCKELPGEIAITRWCR